MEAVLSAQKMRRKPLREKTPKRAQTAETEQLFTKQFWNALNKIPWR